MPWQAVVALSVWVGAVPAIHGIGYFIRQLATVQPGPVD
jgi:hypothetical protein